MKVNRVMKMLRVGEWLFSKLPFLFLPILIYINDFKISIQIDAYKIKKHLFQGAINTD